MTTCIRTRFWRKRCRKKFNTRLMKSFRVPSITKPNGQNGCRIFSVSYFHPKKSRLTKSWIRMLSACFYSYLITLPVLPFVLLHNGCAGVPGIRLNKNASLSVHILHSRSVDDYIPDYPNIIVVIWMSVRRKSADR